MSDETLQEQLDNMGEFVAALLGRVEALEREVEFTPTPPPDTELRFKGGGSVTMHDYKENVDDGKGRPDNFIFPPPDTERAKLVERVKEARTDLRGRIDDYSETIVVFIESVDALLAHDTKVDKS